MAPRKAAVFLFSILLVSLFVILTRREDIRKLSAPSFLSGSLHEPQCKEDLDWLDTYNLSSPFRYASRKLLTNYVPQTDSEPVTLLETPLFSDLQELDLTRDRSRSAKDCGSNITLNVLAPPEPADASHIIFGIQTTIQRLSDTIIHLARWLPNTGAHLYAVVIESEGVPASDHLMETVEFQLHAHGISATLLHPENETDSFPQRYFSLINIMNGHRMPETEWIVLLDDDTFIPSMSALLNTLNKFDSSVPHYVGSLSEDWWAVKHYGLMGFGGAGIFLSIPLASMLTEEKTYSSCKDEMSTSAGDIAVMNCIYSHTPYKLTHIPALHQLDFGGDVSGVYESGRQMLSLHHWKGGWGQALPMDKMHLISDLCDSADCFLRRWEFEDKFVLTNGFSINQYPMGENVSWPGEGNSPGRVQSYVGPLDFMAVERTWNDNEVMDVRHSLEPTRPGLEVGKEKLVHRLIDAVRVGDEIRQVYVRNGEDGGLDTVLVLYWSQG